jgi:hypothetical protein
MHARGEPQVARPEAALAFLIEETGKYLLLDSVRIVAQSFPALVEIDFVEFLVLFPDRHLFLS